MVLQLHGEVTAMRLISLIARRSLLSAICAVWSEQFPQLKIIFEHITTRQAAEFVAESSDNIAATITPQHSAV